MHVEVNNQSWKHDEPKDSEKYLDIIVVSETFEGVAKSKVNYYTRPVSYN